MAKTHVLKRLNDVLFFDRNSVLLRDLVYHITCDEADELSDCSLDQLSGLNVDLCHWSSGILNLDQVLFHDRRFASS